MKRYSPVGDASIMNGIDYCNRLLATVSVYQTDQLNTAARRLLLRVPKFDRELRINVGDQLHWLPAPERVSY